MLWPIMENLLHCRAVGVISHIINQVQYLITEHRPFLAQRNPHCCDSAVRKMHGSSGNMLEINNIHSRAFFSRSINCILNYVKCIFILKSSHFQLQCMLYLRGQSLPTFKKKTTKLSKLTKHPVKKPQMLLYSYILHSLWSTVKAEYYDTVTDDAATHHCLWAQREWVKLQQWGCFSPLWRAIAVIVTAGWLSFGVTPASGSWWYSKYR